MTNQKRGSVLIVVAGVLAALFIVGVTGILIASSAVRETSSGFDGIRSRFAADSALEVGMAAFLDAKQKHGTAETGVNDRTLAPDDGFVRDLVKVYRELTIDGSAKPGLNSVGLTRALWVSDRHEIFDLGVNTDGKRVLSHTAGGPLEPNNLVRAFTYMDHMDTILSLSLPADLSELPEDSYQKCGEGTVKFRLYGWGVVLQSREYPNPVASTYTDAIASIEFEVGAKKEDLGEGVFETRISVYLTSKPKLISRRIRGELAAGLNPDWPEWTVNP